MNNIMEKSLETLAAFDKVCKNAGVQYWLAPSTAAAAKAFGKPLENRVNTRVTMTVDNCKKFIEAMENPMEGYSIEYIGNNNNYRYMNIAFVNENTTYIDLKQGDNLKKYGIRVEITPLRSEKRKKIEAFFELGWECKGYRATYKLSKGRERAIKAVDFFSKINKDKLAQNLWKSVLSEYGSKESKYIYRRFKKRTLYFEKKWFEHTEYISFGDGVYPAPRNLDEYISAQLGDNWEKKIKSRKLRSGIIVLPNIPYCQYLKRLESKNLNVENIWEKEKNNISNREKILDDIKSKNKSWLIANRSGDRLYFLEELTPKMDEIRKLYNEKSFEELREMLREYEGKTTFYLKHGIGFAMNKELLDIQCDLYEYEGRERLAKILREKVPKEHLKAIKEEV